VRADLLAELREILKALGVAPADEELDESTGLLGRGLGLDSIEVLRIVSALEERLAITIDDRELAPEHFYTVGALVRFLEGRTPG
jgi:acyl carrier protein